MFHIIFLSVTDLVTQLAEGFTKTFQTTHRHRGLQLVCDNKIPLQLIFIASSAPNVRKSHIKISSIIVLCISKQKHKITVLQNMLVIFQHVHNHTGIHCISIFVLAFEISSRNRSTPCCVSLLYLCICVDGSIQRLGRQIPAG